jgi:hypothetical protein
MLEIYKGFFRPKLLAQLFARDHVPRALHQSVQHLKGLWPQL